jgi:excinuclease ABC subunit A
VYSRPIELRGVEVHNLKRIDVDLPRGQLIVFCGPSGSGKSSLAIDTLYAEGQRRYIESFSAYTRQFLEQLDKPAAERIDGIPPTVAVTRSTAKRSSRATVGTATEIVEYLRLLFAKIGQRHCPNCNLPVRRHDPQSAAAEINSAESGRRVMIAFAAKSGAESNDDFPALAARLRELGYVRAIVDGQTVSLETPDSAPTHPSDVLVVVDRLTTGETAATRLVESLETAFAAGDGSALALIELDNAELDNAELDNADSSNADSAETRAVQIDGRTFQRIVFDDRLRCGRCRVELAEPEPRLFSFNSPLGACPRCEGFGSVVEIDLDKIVPDRNVSLKKGAIAPWNTKAYAHELEELLALAPDYDLPVDVPVRELSAAQWNLVDQGVADRNFGGLRGFFAWLERRKYKMHIRVFLSRWRSYEMCEECGGSRLRKEALASRIGGKNIAEICSLKSADAKAFFDQLPLDDSERTVGRTMLEQIHARLAYLQAAGLGYLQLDRALRTLSGGETQRVALATSLGSSLVNVLYVLDEPSVGLHLSDVDRLVAAVVNLRKRGNTVVVVEHEEAMIRAADHAVEFGPGAGQRGGAIVFQGSPAAMIAAPESLTGDYLSGRRGGHSAKSRRPPERGRIVLSGARGNNLQNVSVEFPLGLLCVVTGVSGSGKSTLVEKTLYPALCRRLRKSSDRPLPYDDVFGDGQIDDVILVDQSPAGRSPRSNPVTYVKAFDEIRAVFAETLDARTRNLSARHFSFNLDGGRCTKCQGAGVIEIDMQFMADVFMRCDQCQGRRYRAEILAVKYRGRSVADILEMTVREAFAFFRGQTKVQARLKQLVDVGLDYVQLGQGANTLSGGESQRLKLAAHLSSRKRGRSLFLLDEPTVGLHFSDVVQLLDCFDALLDMGHSLVVVEHNMQVIAASDYVVDLGPGAAEAGGRIVAVGPPEQIAAAPESVTGPFIAAALARSQ